MCWEQDKHVEVVGTADLESGYALLQVGPESFNVLVYFWEHLS